MVENKRSNVAYIIMISFIFIFSLAGCAQNTQNVVRQKPVAVSGVQNQINQQSIAVAVNQGAAIQKPSKNEAKQQIKEKEKHSAEINKEDDAYNEEDNYADQEADPDGSTEIADSEEKQEIMENALELLEEADKLWKKGDIEGTLETLDEAYSLIIDANGDPRIAQEKDDVRLLISQRILSVYSSRRTVADGKNREIPLIMNADVEKEIRSFQGLEHDQFVAAYRRSGLYREAIIKELKQAGIPEQFLWLPLVESLFKINAYSSARALGLWQFIPSTGYKFGLSRDEWIDERMDVQKSTKAAIAYLKELHGMFGDWLTVLAAYNCGEGRVLRVISRQHINYLDSFWDLYRQLPNETARYVPRFLATLHIVNNPKKYGFDLSSVENPVDYETVTVNKVMKIKDIAEKIEVSEEVLSLLNSELRHKMTPDREYNLKVPKQSLDKFNLVYNDIPDSEKPSFVSVQNRDLSRHQGGTAFIKHRVKRGETVYSIARKYHVSVASICSYNKLGSRKKLVRGRNLTIPVAKREYYASGKSNDRKQIASSGLYKVKKGETLSMISRRFSIPVNQLKKMNNLKTGNIQTGQNLIISKKAVDVDLQDDTIQNKNVKQSARKAKVGKKTLSATDLDKLGTNKYIVTKRDNLHTIAKKNNINVTKLMQLNKLSKNEKLVPGQILIIR
ncbi:MAG TPA: LysM peptidoglycan-binding domain-containing protein [Smithella sp.]|nr:LysM peptidoglycan-binding domain-containing protein [Smithella sp.]